MKYQKKIAYKRPFALGDRVRHKGFNDVSGSIVAIESCDFCPEAIAAVGLPTDKVREFFHISGFKRV